MAALDTLRMLAGKATPGPWREGIDGNIRVYGPDSRGHHSGVISTFVRRVDASYIAACDPQTILALLDRLDKATELLESVAPLSDENSPIRNWLRSGPHP